MLSCEIEEPRRSSTSALTRYRLWPEALTRYIGRPSHLLLLRVTVWAPVVAVDLNQGVRHLIPLHFPALQKPYASIEWRAGRTVRVTAKREIIAIVDDDDGVRESLRFLLEAAGYTVEAFAAAADFLNADHQNIACLLLDHQMPAMTGLELVKHLKLAEAAMPIVLMTGALSSAIAAQAVALGIVRVLEKPMDGDDVLDLVEATMTSH
jgi:CheY-like chemotaxis protein